MRRRRRIVRGSAAGLVLIAVGVTALVLVKQGGGTTHFSLTGKKSSYSWTGKFEGVIPMLDRRYKETDSVGIRTEIEKYMSVHLCPTCEGRRLRPEALAVTLHDKAIDELSRLPVSDLRLWMGTVPLDKRERAIAEKVVTEIQDRLSFLDDVGVGYLTLDRSSATLSGGESQRIRLATQIGSKLMGVLYVLDEPSIGLHQRDNERLIKTLHRLRDLGNTVLVVEHDEATIEAADWVVDFGPGAGRHGGRVIAEGEPADIKANPDSITGRFLSGVERIEVPAERRAPTSWVKLTGAKEHNLRNVTVEIPLGVMVAVTGVSGAGKSSLINATLYPALNRLLHRALDRVGPYDELTGLEQIDKVIVIDQKPIGRTPRSNPATYTKAFDLIRELYSQVPTALV